jgi:hypothetical protein
VFLKLNQGTGAGSLASSTSIVLILKQFTHDWAAIDTPNIWTCAVPDGKSYTVSSLEFPGFDSTTGPTYISMWTTSGPATEVFRKYRTAQTYTAGDKYVTTYYLSSAEANLHWDEIRIYGGEGATSTFGTGVYLYTISSSDYTKSDLEALQIVITDNHW